MVDTHDATRRNTNKFQLDLEVILGCGCSTSWKNHGHSREITAPLPRCGGGESKPYVYTSARPLFASCKRKFEEIAGRRRLMAQVPGQTHCMNGREVPRSCTEGRNLIMVPVCCTYCAGVVLSVLCCNIFPCPFLLPFLFSPPVPRRNQDREERLRVNRPGRV